MLGGVAKSGPVPKLPSRVGPVRTPCAKEGTKGFCRWFCFRRKGECLREGVDPVCVGLDPGEPVVVDAVTIDRAGGIA